MRAEEITLRVVHKSNKQPQGCFEAAYYEDGTSKTKQCALHVHDQDIAYEIVDLWAQDKAAELGLAYVKVPKAELLGRLKVGSTRMTPKSKTVVEAKTNLGNIKFFKLEIKRAFETLDFAKIREVLKEGTAELNALERERNKIIKNTDKAKANIAQVMYQTFIDTGVDTAQYCSDSEILNEFNRLKAESEKLL